MYRLVLLDAWFLTHAGNATVWWVRTFRIHSNVLVYSMAAIAGIASMLVAAMDRSIVMLGFPFLVAFTLSVRWSRQERSIPTISTPVHGACTVFLLWAIFMLALGELSTFLMHPDVYSAVRGCASVSAFLGYFLLDYLSRIPPLEPPPGGKVSSAWA